MKPSLEFLESLEVKLAGATGEIEGWGSTFGNTDLAGDAVAPGAFARTLAEHKTAGTVPAMLWGHDPDEPIGVWTDAREDAKGLRLKGRLTLGTRRGAEARELAKDGALGLSIGYRTRDSAFERGRRILKDLQLFEVSLVSIPANPQARLTSIKSAGAAGEVTPRLCEQILRDAGVPKSFARALVAGGYRAASDGRDDDREALAALTRDMKSRAAALSLLTKGTKR